MLTASDLRWWRCIQFCKKSRCLGPVSVFQSGLQYFKFSRRPEPDLAAASIHGVVALIPQRKSVMMHHVLRVHHTDLLLRLLHTNKINIIINTCMVIHFLLYKHAISDSVSCSYSGSDRAMSYKYTTEQP